MAGQQGHQLRIVSRDPATGTSVEQILTSLVVAGTHYLVTFSLLPGQAADTLPQCEAQLASLRLGG